MFHLGDVVYSFGEAQYYYDQFYEPYRSYPRPIIAIAGNHDGMVAPGSTTDTLKAFLDNFCATAPVQTVEAGGLDRTSMIQPGVYYTFEAPFVRILALYSNRLEDPGVISSQGETYPELSNVQLDFLKAALQRIASEKFAGAVIFAVHHPPFTTGAHGGSPLMLKEMDAICKATGVWPHAMLSGHAHSYQRYTRATGGMEIPYVIAGNGGHGLTPLTKWGSPPLRAPVVLNDVPGVTFENYDDTDYGYLRVIANAQQLRIEITRPRTEPPRKRRTIPLRSIWNRASWYTSRRRKPKDGPATSFRCIERNVIAVQSGIPRPRWPWLREVGLAVAVIAAVRRAPSISSAHITARTRP